MMILLCVDGDAAEFSGLITGLLMNLIGFHFLVFCCYAAHRIIRRILR
jgi:hypothetical protein